MKKSACNEWTCTLLIVYKHFIVREVIEESRQPVDTHAAEIGQESGLQFVPELQPVLVHHTIEDNAQIRVPFVQIIQRENTAIQVHVKIHIINPQVAFSLPELHENLEGNIQMEILGIDVETSIARCPEQQEFGIEIKLSDAFKTWYPDFDQYFLLGWILLEPFDW